MVLKRKKLPDAVKNLEAALEQHRSRPSELNFLTVSKAFEIALEYAWRQLKLIVEDQGLDVPSPKMAIKEGARLGLITDPEIWLRCIDARNSSVHDYFGISEKEYIELAVQLLKVIKQSKIS